MYKYITIKRILTYSKNKRKIKRVFIVVDDARKNTERKFFIEQKITGAGVA